MEDSFLTLSPCFLHVVSGVSGESYTFKGLRRLFLFFYLGFLFPLTFEHKAEELGGIYFSTETYAVTYFSYHVSDILLLTYMHFKINPHQNYKHINKFKPSWGNPYITILISDYSEHK